MVSGILRHHLTLIFSRSCKENLWKLGQTFLTDWLTVSWSIQDQTWLRSCGHSVVCNDWWNWDIVGDSNNITRVTLIILFLFSSSSSESREDQRSLYIISDVLFLKYHTRNICSISNAWKDQYYNTYHDNGFNENESKWRDCNN